MYSVCIYVIWRNLLQVPVEFEVFTPKFQLNLNDFPQVPDNVTSIVYWQGALKYQSVLNNTSIISSLNVSGHTTLNNNESVRCSGFWAKLQHADRPTGLGPGSQVTCRSNSFLSNASVFDVWGAEALEVRITLQDLFSRNGIFCLQ